MGKKSKESAGRGRGRPNHWRELWRRHPERMRDNLNALVGIARSKAIQRQTRLLALLPLMPAKAMPSYLLRDHLTEAWEEVFGEELTSAKAWNEVRFGIRRGIFRLRADGLYDTMSHVRDAEEGMGTVPEDQDEG